MIRSEAKEQEQWYNNNVKAVSLFASSGIGDLALKANDFDVIVANELLPDRAKLFSHNYPDTNMICGDIWKKEDEIVNETLKRLDGKELDFLLATPPCQGMSKNGQGKLLNEIRKGNRPKIDPRNRLIIPTLKIIKRLHPIIVMFENVPEMRYTTIDTEDGRMVNILDYIKEELGDEYSGRAEVVEFADYGVPQRRKRLITIYSRNEKLKKSFDDLGTFLPPKTHSEVPQFGELPWVTVKDAIGSVPPLDAKEKKTATSDIPFHSVPVLDEKKYFWVSNTPPEKGAFDNQCINPECGYQNNPTHSSKRDSNGINKASTDTPLYCIKCGSLLPRPYTEDNGEKRIMKGFTSAYKRMSWDKPSATLTTNFSFPSSDQKIHPDQNRVLSFYEAFILHTVNQYDFDWGNSTKGLIRDTIGESVPPLALDKIIKYLISLLD